MLERIKNITCFIQSRVEFAPEIGIILGSGLGGLVDEIHVCAELGYDEIPYFPHSTVEGHKGRLIFGTLAGKRVVAMQGRFHYYEGYSSSEVVLPIRVLKMLGIEYLFVSNAAGGLNPSLEVGDLMVITDHINFIPNPLIGANEAEFGVRFPDMANAYDKSLIAHAKELERKTCMKFKYGCYVGVTGPSYETSAECGFYRMIGGDVVGMSTTPEVIAAAHCGLKLFAVSVVTNMIGASIATHEEVQREGVKAARQMTDLFVNVLLKLQ